MRQSEVRTATLAKGKHHTGNGFGLSLGAAATSWPTPMAGTPAQNGNSAAGSSDFSRKAEELARAMWKTPDVPNGGRALKPGTSETGKRPDGSKAQVGLENQAKMWGTPRASDAEKGGPNQSFGAGGTPLPAQAAQWPTPMAGTPSQNGNSAAGSNDFTRKADLLAAGVLASSWPTPVAQNVKGSSEGSIIRADGKSRMNILHYRAEQGFSHPAPETQPHGPTLSQLRRIWRPLRGSLIASHGRATWRRLWNGRAKRRLNPLFVEWLMGWPPGHALCACSATEFARWQQHMRGALSALPTASGPWIWAPPNAAQKPVQIEMFGG